MYRLDMADKTEQPIVNIVGEQVALGPIRRDLLPLFTRWFNDFAVLRMLAVRGPGPQTAEAEAAWYERASVQDESAVYFTIYERAVMRPIGTTSLMHIDHFSRTATFGIVIGEKDCWGQGCGTEATRLMLAYAFGVLGLHNVLLQVYASNERGLRACRRAGFREIGRRREAHREAGQPQDVVYMDCLATDFDHSDLTRQMIGG